MLRRRGVGRPSGRHAERVADTSPNQKGVAMIRSSLRKAFATCLLAGSALVPPVAAADTPVIANRPGDSAPDTSRFGPPQSILFWTPEQQRIGYPNMDRIFLTRTISRGDAKAHPAFALPDAPRDLQKLTFTVDGATHTLADYLEHNRVAGLLVIHDGRVAYEHYALGHTRDSKWTSFSVAKSLTSMLVGAAIRDGYIHDVNDQVTTYLPVLKGSAYDGVSIRQVLQMSSGVAWNEDYADPKSDVARIGAVAAQGGSLGLVKYMGALPRAAQPGEKFNYNTGETHLAGAIVRAAVGNNLSSYLSQKIWSKFAMESDAYWMLADEYGAEHAGCCISATLRDYGRIGMLALRKGVLADGTAIVPDTWMRDATTPSPANPGYGYQWWLNGPGDFGARGIFGQSIQIYEPQNLVIVTHGLWPVATSKEYSAWRKAFAEAVRDTLAHTSGTGR
jgi:CubicO group peptidase (beta-lactamase class C family)